MPDYGHDLQFGFFLDPTATDPPRTVEIARVLDRLGYDGFVGCEYIPAAGTAAGLSWFAPYRS